MALEIYEEVRAKILLGTLMNKDYIIFIDIILFLKVQGNFLDRLFDNTVDFADSNFRYFLLTL